jgi:ATP-dependent DNA ligase
MPPVEPMLGRAVAEFPAGWWYEPKWDGFRAIVFRDGDRVQIFSRNGRPLARYFPEVVEAAKESFPQRCVVDGEVIITDPESGRLDFWALQQRLHPAESRVRLLSETTPAGYVAFDLLALHDDDYMPRSFAERRAALEMAFSSSSAPVHVTPSTRDAEVAHRWFTVFEGAGLDGIVAKEGQGHYQPGKRVMRKIKHQRTADCVVVGYRVHASIPEAVGSLLLALHDDGVGPELEWAGPFGGLLPVGVVGAFTARRRRELMVELEPLVVDIADHPWDRAMSEFGSQPAGEMGSRWNPGKDLSFVPLRPELVVEVRYDHMEGSRFRHPAQFVRWRPDRIAASCGYAQLERPAPYDVSDILGISTSL